MVIASRRRLAEFGEMLTKHLRNMGESLRVLNRTISIDIELDATVFEPDQCHVSKMVEELGLAYCKSVKPDVEAHLQTENSQIFEPQAATFHRSCTMRTAYLARDRLDTSESVKCRHKQALREGHMVELKRSARFLRGNRQRVQISKCMWVQIGLETGKADAGRRDDDQTRQARYMSATQTCIGRSSADSEHYAITRGAGSAMGTQSHRGRLAGVGSDLSIPRFISGTRRDAAERTWQEVETCSDTTLVVAGTRGDVARGAEMHCWR